MNSEQSIIERIITNFKKSEKHKNEFFQSDSEIIQLGNQDFLFTIDNYSDEDHFRTNNPYLLGKNLTICTLSDIFACGGTPIFFSNSLIKSNNWDENYIDLFSKGMSNVLNQCETAFIGGDLGFSENWNFTGVAIGKSKKVVTRVGAKAGDLIYITGSIGNGNFESASQLSQLVAGLELIFDNHIIEFPLRIKEAKIVEQYASSCIDTSDGLFKSLDIISKINNTGFQLINVPICTPGKILTKALNLPDEILIFGESGEYELMFTVHPENEENMLNASAEKGIDLFKIGSILENPNQFLIRKDGFNINFSDFDIYARDFENHYLYVETLKSYLSKKFENE